MNTKRHILKTTGKLFSQRGYFGVSMQDIANELGITKAALYYHFASKDELAEQLLRDSVKELEQELQKAITTSILPTNILFNIIKTFLDFKIKHPEISLLTTLGSGSDEQIPILALVSDLRVELIRFVRELVENADFTQTLTYQTIVTLVTSIISVTLSPFYHTGKQNSEQSAQDLSDVLTKQTLWETR